MAQTGEESDDGALAEVARELYAGPPAEFVAARNARAAEVRRAGDRALATRVKALPKPSAPAWAVGLLAREEPGELDALGELGAELRVAQASANPVELRALGRRRRELAAALTRTAARLAEERGVPLSAAAQEQVELTWQAVVIEPTAERAVRSLLLVRTLEPGDLGGVALDGALAVPVDVGREDEDADDAPAPPPRRRSRLRAVPQEQAEEDETSGPGATEDGTRTSEPDVAEDEAPSRRRASSRRGARDDEEAPRGTRRGRAPERREEEPASTHRRRKAGDGPARSPADLAREVRRAERELRARERAVTQARADREEAQEELARVEARVLQLAARAEELRRELEELEDELEELDEERSAAREEREDAEEREATAERAVEEVRARLAELAED